MKKMHAFAKQPIVIDCSNNSEITAGTAGYKALKACFEAARNHKPIPYEIYAVNNDFVFRKFTLTYHSHMEEKVKKEFYLFVAYDLNETYDKLIPLYYVSEELLEGNYSMNEI